MENVLKGQSSENKDNWKAHTSFTFHLI